MTDLIHVAAGIITDDQGRVLVQRRPDHAHVGGLWEFPGGKADAAETREEALARELREELGIEVRAARPLIQVRHDYPEKSVLLDVWRVERFEGEPRPLEGQPLDWVEPDDLAKLAMPAADRPIVHAVRLPDACLITSNEPSGINEFLGRLENRLKDGTRLVQIRVDRDRDALKELVQRCVSLCNVYGTWLILNGDPEDALVWGAHGVHLNGKRLREFTQRPVPRDIWLSAACHNWDELGLAIGVDVDFVIASPVKPTTSHPGAATLGLDGFSALCAEAPVPVYALGGMAADDREEVWRAGGQGFAGISGFW